MKLMKWNEKSKGLGDTIKKITSASKLDKLAEKIAEVAGAEDCGCDKRQEKLNQMFPYSYKGTPGSNDGVTIFESEERKARREKLQSKFRKRI